MNIKEIAKLAKVSTATVSIVYPLSTRFWRGGYGGLYARSATTLTLKRGRSVPDAVEFLA